MRDMTICEGCGARGVKLWRSYGLFLWNASLFCVDCACKDQTEGNEIYASFLATPEGKVPSPLKHCRGRFGYEIGWMVPLITAEDGAVWGYTSCPPEDIARWEALPLRGMA